MRTIPALLAVLAATPCLRSQAGPAVKLTLLSRIDHGLGGFLQFPDGTRGEFHIEVSATCSRLLDRRSPTESSAHELTVGSDGEARILQALDQWLAATFSPEEQKALLALERLPDARTQNEDFARQRAELLRTVRRYSEVSRPRIDKVFAGRGTVGLSLQLRLGERPPQQLLWRSLGDESFARLHLDTETEPVAIDSRTESHLLLGIANWLAKRTGSREALWQPEPEDLPDDVCLVLSAYRGYLEATSPRLRAAGTVMDNGNGGSKMFELSDAQRRVTSVRFDYAAGTATPGRLRDGGGRNAPLVDLGSPREAELLAILRRAAELRRRWHAGDAQDWQLEALESELEKYRTVFQDQAKGK